MKTNSTLKPKKPLHLHIEHFSRMRVCLLIVISLLFVAIVKTDSKLLGVVRDAYAEGFGLVGTYMREETTRTPVTFNVLRSPTISGK